MQAELREVGAQQKRIERAMASNAVHDNKDFQQEMLTAGRKVIHPCADQAADI